MIGYETSIFKPIRKSLPTSHWLSINCTSLEVDARRDFCVWAEEYVAEEMDGDVTNEFGEADTMLYDVLVDDQNLYVSVKSSSNATSVRDCITRSKVKASPLVSAIGLRNNDDLFCQVYVHYIPDDREICWFQTPTMTFKDLEKRYNNGNIKIDSLGRLSAQSHDIIFGEPLLKKIIDLPEIDVELEKKKSKLIKAVKRITNYEQIKKLSNVLKIDF